MNFINLLVVSKLCMCLRGVFTFNFFKRGFFLFIKSHFHKLPKGNKILPRNISDVSHSHLDIASKHEFKNPYMLWYPFRNDPVIVYSLFLSPSLIVCSFVMKVAQGEALGNFYYKSAEKPKMFSLFIVSFHNIFANLQRRQNYYM